MSSYGDPKKEIIYTDGSAMPSEGVYPSSYTGGTTGASGAAGDAAALPTDSYGYAEWLRNKSYQNATDLANKARQDALLNKQNALVGADTAYQQGLATYGANAESLANKGLSNSGYGEYLTGKNYATARAEKAAANATYQGAMNDILYQENSAKQSADQLYADTMIKLKEKDKEDAQSAYDSLLMSAQSGTDISALQWDARWALISPEQRNAITAASNEYMRGAADKFVVGAIESIRNGTMTLDEVKAMGGWATAGTEGQTRIEAAASEVTRGKTFDEILRNIKAGDYNKNSVERAPGWDTLTDAEKDQAFDEIDLREDSIKAGKAENRREVIKNIKSGNYSLYDDDELSRMVTDEYISADDLDLIKQERAKAAISSIESDINDEDMGALKTTRGLNMLIANIDAFESDKFISSTEAESLRDKAYREAFRVDDHIKAFAADLEDVKGIIYVAISGEGSYRSAGVKAPVVSPDSDIYNKLNTYAKKGDNVVEFNGKYYVYDDTTWYDVTNAVNIRKNESSK